MSSYERKARQWCKDLPKDASDKEVLGVLRWFLGRTNGRIVKQADHRVLAEVPMLRGLREFGDGGTLSLAIQHGGNTKRVVLPDYVRQLVRAIKASGILDTEED